MAKILMVSGDAAEDLEVMYPYQRLLEEGYEVHLAASSAETLQFVAHDFVDGFDTYTGKPRHTWPARPSPAAWAQAVSSFTFAVSCRSSR